MFNRGFAEFCEFLKVETGITLEASKHYLVFSRLNRLMTEHQIDSLMDLVDLLNQPNRRDLKQVVIESMTTNETQWFRDNYPLQAFADEIIPFLVKGGHRSVRIWSAACSSGQEPYSISMVIEEQLEGYQHSHLNTSSIKIIGTDLSSQILQKARDGKYDKAEIERGLSGKRRQNFFTHCHDGPGGEYWQANQAIKQRIEFKQHNLLNSYSGLGQFDVIFCRNVLIYFSREIKTDILNRMAKQLKPGGYLILGSSETPSHYTDWFRMEKMGGAVVYRLDKSSK